MAEEKAAPKQGEIKIASREGTADKKRDFDSSEPINHEQERIRRWLKEVHFKKSLFGGVDEADVWKKIAKLNTLYETALSAERARYDALLKERCSKNTESKEADEDSED